MRWILLTIAVIALSVAFSAKAPVVIGFGYLVGLVCLCASFVAFAAQRIASTARPDVAMITPTEMQSLRANPPAPKPPSAGSA